MNENTILHTVPAAGELHKVPGFDPMKHLRRTVNAQGESVLRLEPRYQRLWFRLACPKGRMLLNPLRLTDQMAIFEAKVFFHRDDPTPASSFTSNKTASETPDYIRAAQDEALREALDNAGFGIQLCDVTRPGGEGEISLSAAPAVKNSAPSAAEKTAPAKTAPSETAPVSPAAKQTPPVQAAAASAPPTAERPQAADPVPTEQPTASARTMEAPAAETAPKPAPTAQPVEPVVTAAEPAPEHTAHQDTPAPQGEDAPADDPQPPLSSVLNFPAKTPETASKQENGTGSDAPATADAPVSSAPADATPGQTGTAPQASPAYTDDMPVEQILPLMTLEEARAVVVQSGPCKGWTMAQVAERRFASLRFFLTPFCESGNIQKAAATLLMQDLEQKKAG